MKFQINQPAIKIAFFLISFCLPAIFAQQKNGRQMVELEQARELMDKEKHAAALPMLYSMLQHTEQQSDWIFFDSICVDISNCWYALNHSDSCCIFLEKAIQTLSDAHQRERVGTARLYTFLAFNYKKQEQYLDALNNYQQALRIYERLGTLNDQVAYAYKNAAQVMVRFDNHTLARQYLEAAIRVDTAGILHAAVYAQMANNSHYEGNEEDVMHFYELGMEAWKSGMEEEEDTKANLQAAGSSAFVARHNYVKAKELLQSAVAYYRSGPQYWTDNLVTCLTDIAEIADLQHRPAEAERYFRQAEMIGKSRYDGKSREMAKLFVRAGLFYEKTDRPDLALEYYQKALEHVWEFLTVNEVFSDKYLAAA